MFFFLFQLWRDSPNRTFASAYIAWRISFAYSGTLYGDVTPDSDTDSGHWVQSKRRHRLNAKWDGGGRHQNNRLYPESFFIVKYEFGFSICLWCFGRRLTLFCMYCTQIPCRTSADPMTGNFRSTIKRLVTIKKNILLSPLCVRLWPTPARLSAVFIFIFIFFVARHSSDSKI